MERLVPTLAPRAQWSVHVHVDRYTLEAIVEELYGRAGAERGDVWLPSQIARKLGIRLTRTPNAIARGALGRLGDTPVVSVRAGLPRAIEEWTIGHELGHWMGLTRDEELACDFVGAAVQMRRRPFLRALNEHRDEWHRLGPLFRATSTSAALRAAELEERALAVVTPSRVYPRLIQLSDLEIRRLARVGGPGLARTRLVDDRRRVVLEATEIEAI